MLLQKEETLNTVMPKLKADVVVVGAGVMGSAIARELSKYQVDVILIDRNEDVGGEASLANNASVICGYDFVPGSLDSQMAVAASPMFDKLAKDLDIHFERIGALQVALTEEEMDTLVETHQLALKNGVYDVELISGDEARRMEPNLSEYVLGAMVIPRQAIIDVFGLVVAYTENAADNGVRLMLGTKALEIRKENGVVRSVVTTRGEIETRFVVNAAGLHADALAQTAGICDFENYPRKGEFFVLDKKLPYKPKHIIASVPTALSRGKLLTPSVEGNLLLGPTADNIKDKSDTATSRQGLAEVLADVQKKIPAVSSRDSVTQFTGLRPKRIPDELSIRAVKGVSGYIEANGSSAGVTVSPAAAVYTAELLKRERLALVRKPDFNPIRRSIRKFGGATPGEREALIKEDSRYANIICRCEIVSEAEIVEAISRGASSVDAIKRRLRAGMGRCQGGFCLPRVIEIMARELHVPAEQIRKNEPGSEYLTGPNKQIFGERGNHELLSV
jgi:glycerol-3-phosphate dehydrogenase